MTIYIFFASASSEAKCCLHELCESQYQHYLKVTFKPRILCENCNWESDKIRDKYIDLIYEKLKHFNNAFSNINLVIKEEVRYLR